MVGEHSCVPTVARVVSTPQGTNDCYDVQSNSPARGIKSRSVRGKFHKRNTALSLKVGGGSGRPRPMYTVASLSDHSLRPLHSAAHMKAEFLYEVDHILVDADYASDEFVVTRPFMALLQRESRKTLEVVARKHSIPCKRGDTVDALRI